MADSLNASDVYQRYTAKFTWQSNQVGHAGMGFFFTSLVLLSVHLLDGSSWWGLAFVVTPVVKDVGDYLGDANRKGRKFGANRWELARDGIADSLFWSAGCLIAVGIALLARGDASTSTLWVYWIAIAVVLASGLGWAAWHFFGEKSSFDRSALPYYYRLPNFDGDIGGQDVAWVEAFMERPGPPARHVVIGGPRGSGKTTLGSAIAASLTTRRWHCRKVRYFTAAKLQDFFGAGGSDDDHDPQEPWRFDQAEILIVDDLPPISADADAPLPAVCGTILDACETGLLDKKSVIWLLGGSGRTDGWRDWLEQNVVPVDGDLHAIDLGPWPPPEKDGGRSPVEILTWVLAKGFFVLLAANVLLPILVLICRGGRGGA